MDLLKKKYDKQYIILFIHFWFIELLDNVIINVIKVEILYKLIKNSRIYNVRQYLLVFRMSKNGLTVD